jgi:hypothetical protein
MRFGHVVQAPTLILHDPPMLIPPIPPAAAPVDEGIAIPVPVGLMTIAADAIVMPSMFIFTYEFRAIVDWC